MASKSDLFARLSLDYADHPKIAALSDAAFRAHIELILYARKYETDGIIKNPVANRLGSRWETDVLTELQNNDDQAPSLVRLENGDYMIHGYADMQETKAEIEERRRRNRGNGRKGGRPPKTKKPSGLPSGFPEQNPVANPVGNPNETQNITQTKAETETETETETDKKRVKRAKPKLPIPEDWKPTESHAAKAAQLSLDLSNEAMKFRTFHESKDNRYADWGKAFHTWLTRAAEYNTGKPRLPAVDRERQITQQRHERLQQIAQQGADVFWQPKQIEDA